MAKTQIQWLLRGVLPALRDRCGISYTVEQSKHIKVKLSNGTGATGNVTVSSTPGGNIRDVRLKVLGDIRREVIQKFGLDSIRFGSLNSFPLENIVSVSAAIAAENARLNREWDDFCEHLVNLPEKPVAMQQKSTTEVAPPPPERPKSKFGRFRQIPEEDN